MRSRIGRNYYRFEEFSILLISEWIEKWDKIITLTINSFLNFIQTLEKWRQTSVCHASSVFTYIAQTIIFLALAFDGIYLLRLPLFTFFRSLKPMQRIFTCTFPYSPEVYFQAVFYVCTLVLSFELLIPSISIYSVVVFGLYR